LLHAVFWSLFGKTACCEANFSPDGKAVSHKAGTGTKRAQEFAKCDAASPRAQKKSFHALPLSVADCALVR
jgi:hypothetical protein